MKKAATIYLSLLLGLGAGVGVLELAAPADTQAHAQDSRARRSERREERRDALQDTFTGWDRLGERTVNTNHANDSIAVGSSSHGIDRIRLRVESGSLVLNHVVVTYADGQTYEANADFAFSESQKSHEIDLPGAARPIRRVDFQYSNLPNGQTAQIELWGR